MQIYKAADIHLARDKLPPRIAYNIHAVRRCDLLKIQATQKVKQYGDGIQNQSPGAQSPHYKLNMIHATSNPLAASAYLNQMPKPV